MPKTTCHNYYSLLILGKDTHDSNWPPHQIMPVCVMGEVNSQRNEIQNLEFVMHGTVQLATPLRENSK